MKKMNAFVIIIALLIGACTNTSSQNTPTASSSDENWQTFTNTEAGYTLRVPSTWSQKVLPDQNSGSIHGEAYTGAEGGVEIYWGVGFGGACPSGTTTVHLADVEVTTCYTKNSDGTESWNQIDYVVPGGNAFSNRAYTSNSEQSSHDLILLVLSTLSFIIPTQTETNSGIANPASQNCINKGGTLTIESRGDGGQFGVCTFEDNRQCEEWALMRGECPVGGLKVTGYVTPAAKYCVITGGTYTITGESNTENEQGNCTFSSGVRCDVWDYFNRKCSSTTGAVSTPGLTIQPLIMEVCDGEAQAMSHTLHDMIPTQSEAPISDPVNNATGTGCESTITGTGEQFESPAVVVGELGNMLKEEGWTADPMLVADGPTGTAQGYRKDNQICWVGAQWFPNASANCPKDQPITTCDINPQQKSYTVTLNCGVENGK